MKEGIHPEYKICKVTCACGASFETRSILDKINVEVCSKCHPFYTGQQKFVDTAGRIEKFTRKYKEFKAMDRNKGALKKEKPPEPVKTRKPKVPAEAKAKPGPNVPETTSTPAAPATSAAPAAPAAPATPAAPQAPAAPDTPAAPEVQNTPPAAPPPESTT